MSIERKSYEVGIAYEKERILKIIDNMISGIDQSDYKVSKTKKKILMELRNCI